jgi:flagellar biosynthesis/type III secretory pathway protein FliH
MVAAERHKARAHKPPSRVRYEASHLTVSCRVPKEIYERLQALREKGHSFADILKMGLRLAAPKLNRAYQRGYQDGYKAAEETYKVTYDCIVCGQPCVVQAREVKEAVNRYMREHGWGHTACHQRR